MKKIFSNYYKIILSVVILIVLVALKENYKTSFDEMAPRFFHPAQKSSAPEEETGRCRGRRRIQFL